MLSPSSSTFTVILYGLLAVALYIYLIYYNNTLFAVFYTTHCKNASPVILLYMFFSLVNLTLIISIHHS